MAETRTTSSTGGQKGTKLARHDLIPPGPLTALAEHYGRGARKYANHQWRKGYEWSKSYAAMIRHATLWNMGYDYDVCSNDPEGCSFVDADGNAYEPDEPDTCFNHTGSHHMAAVAWHAFLLLEFKDAHPEHDDRYRPEPVDDDDDEPRFPGRVWVGPAKLLPEDGWEEVGYTTLDESWLLKPEDMGELFSPSAGTHDYASAIDFSIADVNHDLLRLLFGGPVKTRFICGVGGTRDLEKPLPEKIEEQIDAGMVLVAIIDDSWMLAHPSAFEWSFPQPSRLSWLDDYDAEHQIPQYLAEYRLGLDVDSVGGVL